MTYTAAQCGLQKLNEAAKLLGKAENELQGKFFLPPIPFTICNSHITSTRDVSGLNCDARGRSNLNRIHPE